MEVEVAEVATEHHEMRPFAGVEAQGMYPHGSSFMSSISTTSCTISYNASAKIYLSVLIVITCVPLIAGGAFTIIFIEDRNVHGAVCSFFAGAISLGTLSLFVLHLLKKLDKYHDRATLSGLKVLGMIVSVMAGVSLGIYTILAFLKKQALELKGDNYFSAAIFSGLCLVSSLQLYIAAQWYQNALEKNKVIITHQVPAVAGPSRAR